MASVAITDKYSATKSLSLADSKATISDYLVKKHDTLCSIAVTYNTTTSSLMKLNKMSSSLIFPGQVIQVPKSEDIVVEMETPSVETMIASKDYDFLAPLSTSPASVVTVKPFQDLVVVSSPDQHFERNGDKVSKVSSSDKVKLNSESRLASSRSLSSTADDTCSKSSLKRERMISIDSNMSEPFEENFVKMNAYYISNACDLVRGVFLTTPTSIMFDPDPTCPPALEQGCEKFGIMCDLNNVISIGLYNDTRSFAKKKSVQSCNSEKSIEEADSESIESSCRTNLDRKESTDKKTAFKEAKPDDSSKLSFEFPFLYSLVKSVEGN